MANDACQRLLYYLVKRAFDPILKASPRDNQSEDRKKELCDVPCTSQSTQHRYHTSYTSVAGVYQTYERLLSSAAA